MPTILFVGFAHWKDNKAQVLGLGMDRRIFLTGDTGVQRSEFKLFDFLYALHGRH
jgi:hypothetical protein